MKIGAPRILSAFLAAAAIGVFSCENKPAPQIPAGPSAKGPDGRIQAVLSTSTTPGGVSVEEIKVGTGDEVTAGSTITVYFEGKLINGNVVQSSFLTGEPTTMPLAQFIKGWQEGLLGMRAGGVRRLTIPAALGYGAEGIPGGPIPPNSTMIFWIQLERVK